MEQHPIIFLFSIWQMLSMDVGQFYPIPLEQACSFHPELVPEAASIAASEASFRRAKGNIFLL